jgi:GT2 family glycosyltransferase
LLEKGWYSRLMFPSVSIIIVNYNGKPFLKECLESIGNSEAGEEEVIIVDNASADGSVAYIRDRFPSVKIMELEKNYGFAEANNRGAKCAKGEFLVFLNNDTVVTPGWLKALLKVISSDHSIGAVGSKLLMYQVPHRVNSAGANIVFNGRGYDIGFMDSDAEKYNVSGPRGAVCAASMMVRKTEFLSLGGFDSMYFMYFEDVDLCWRYWLSGFKVMYVADSVVYHHFGGAAGNTRHTPIRVFYGARNSNYNIIKNFAFPYVFMPLIFNLFYYSGNFFLFLFTFKLKSALLIPKAYGSLFNNFPRLLKKRNHIQRSRKINDRYFTENYLIVSISEVIKEIFRLMKIK